MKHIKSIVLLILIISMLSSLISAAALTAEKGANTSVILSYNDIKGTWSEKWVESYGYSEIFSNSDGSFRPEQAITRMEFARLLHKALGININYFAATDIGDYYNDV